VRRTAPLRVKHNPIDWERAAQMHRGDPLPEPEPEPEPTPKPAPRALPYAGRISNAREQAIYLRLRAEWSAAQAALGRNTRPGSRERKAMVAQAIEEAAR
jgi:hypothetical protein